MSKYNHMVPYKKNDLKKKQTYRKNFLDLDEKNFDPSKVDMGA